MKLLTKLWQHIKCMLGYHPFVYGDFPALPAKANSLGDPAHWEGTCAACGKKNKIRLIEPEVGGR